VRDNLQYFPVDKGAFVKKHLFELARKDPSTQNLYFDSRTGELFDNYDEDNNRLGINANWYPVYDQDDYLGYNCPKGFVSKENVIEITT
jgi:hypothetical protein